MNEGMEFSLHIKENPVLLLCENTGPVKLPETAFHLSYILFPPEEAIL
jgi:hypothetical protein